MVEIGGRPILWHIMKHYAAHGFDEFVLALGYKGDEIKRYFTGLPGARRRPDVATWRRARSSDLEPAGRLDRPPRGHRA